MLDQIWNVLLDWLKYRWANKTTLLILIAIGLVGGAYFTMQIVGAESTPVLLGAISITLIIIGIWVYTTRIPINRAGKIGLVISITSETEEEQRKIRSDFISEIRNVLTTVHHDIPFDVIELPPIHALKIADADSAREYLHKTKSHFLVYGSIRTRTAKGKLVHVLQFQGMVTHKRIPLEVSAVLSNEMKLVLPLKSTISCEDDLKGFETTTMWFSESTKFVIATAAMVSGDLPLAVLLLENLSAAIKKIPKAKQIPQAKSLRQLVPSRLSDVYLCSARHEHSLWRINHDPGHIVKLNDFITAYAIHHKHQDIHFHTMKAIWEFVARKDVKAAIAHISKCSTLAISDPIWRLSLAFLYAYDEQMDKAVACYEDAFSFSPPSETIFEVEEFVIWTLSEEPTKYQLHFCLGLLNLRGKGDRDRAHMDFNEFLRSDSGEKFQTSVLVAKKYIEKIEEDLEKLSLKPREIHIPSAPSLA